MGCCGCRIAESDDVPEVISGAWSAWTPTEVQLVVGSQGDTEFSVAHGARAAAC